MKYLCVLLLSVIFLSSCQKSSNLNLSRSALLGRYHFTLVDVNAGISKNGFDTSRYDGTISIAQPDDGNGISISYPTISQQTICKTSDSSFMSIVYLCPNSSSPLSGHYQHDTLFMTDPSYGCETNNPNLYVSIIGVKY